MSVDDNCILAAMAHPDDIEFMCAGTLCRLKDLGWRVAMATMTAGDCGSATLPPDEISAIRLAEAQASADLLGASYDCLEQLDLFVILSGELIQKTVELMRRIRPKVVITHAPADYMLDHDQTSVVVRAATFGAPIRNYSTGAPDPAPPLEAIPYLYYADPIEGLDTHGQRVEADLHIDITDVMDRKEAMLACHASQREWLLKHHGVDEYLRSMRAWAQQRGADSGVAYAEGFRQHRGHAYPADDLLGALLAD